MIPEPCEFSSKELVDQCIVTLTGAIDSGDLGLSSARDMAYKLRQASAQLEHNNGKATPFPEKKDPWAWEDADTYGPSA